MALKNPSVNCFRKFKRLQLTFQVVFARLKRLTLRCPEALRTLVPILCGRKWPMQCSKPLLAFYTLLEL
jgi:hypothetical protein